MEFKDLLSALWKRKYLVISVIAATTLLSALFAFSRAEQYESTAVVALTPSQSNGAFLSPDALDALVGTYAQTAKSDVMRQKASKELGEPLPGTVDTATQPGTGILQIIGKAETPEGAAATAQAVSAAFLEELETNDLFETQIVDPAEPAGEPVQPRPPLIIAIGIVLGALAGIMLAYVLEQVRRRIDGSGDIAEITPLPIVGTLPYQRRLARSPSRLIWDNPDLEALQESLRALRTNIEVLVGKRNAIVQVTSPVAGEGKSTIVANLGVALAQVGIKTLIVDADLRRPSQHEIFNVPNDAGLSSFLGSRSRPQLRPQPTGISRLSVLPSGPIPHSSTEMLHVRSAQLIEALHESEELVLVDTPPLLPVSDARILAAKVDGVLLTVAAGTEKPSALRSALDTLQFAGAPILGIVLNRASEQFAGPNYGYSRRDLRQAAGEPAGTSAFK
ncbi:MAG TPA: polysaccharide biosynthesis tyrosine autokinase [Solirubrobacterales bacterium]|jgi:capsular exopolysaccharide synthesis family protein|nr:polysaccharide biosynthesis tyrosine autokinase [Solirubrobacterales bacterium]